MKYPKAIVCCRTHGTYNNDNGQYEVKIGMPSTKRERMSGCPLCKRDANKKST